MSTLKSNNIRLTSALQESTANVDEWKRQLHQYKEENNQLKVALGKPASASGTGSGGNSNNAEAVAVNEEMRRETILLKSRIQSLEKELMNTEIELKASNKSLKEKNNDQTVIIFNLKFLN